MGEYYTTSPEDILVGRTKIGDEYWTVYENNSVIRTYWCIHGKPEEDCYSHHWLKDDILERCHRCGTEIPREILFLYRMCVINV